MNRLIVAPLLVGMIQTAAAAGASPAVHDHETTALSAAATLRQNMRVLWSDHVIWTREYNVAAVADQPDQQPAAARLMRNQEDIGAALAAYYGPQAGARLTELLKAHIGIAVGLIEAAEAGDNAAQRDSDRDDERPPRHDHRRGHRTVNEELGAGRARVRCRSMATF